MKTIYKFALAEITNTIMMPSNSKILHVASQNNHAHLWVLCDPSEPNFERTFCIFGTGFDIPEDKYTYLGSVHTSDEFVWHVFEKEL